MSDSSACGFLQPTTQPLNDDPLQDLLWKWLQGLTQIPGALVRPAWQANPPQRPDASVNWLAFRIGDRDGDWDGFVQHQGAGTTLGGTSGADLLYTNEELVLECSAYGPNSDATYSGVFLGTKISQNLDLLRRNGMGFIEVGKPRPFGERIKEITLRRVDFRVRLRRAVSLTYPVLDVESAAAELILDDPLIEQSLGPDPGV